MSGEKNKDSNGMNVGLNDAIEFGKLVYESENRGGSQGAHFPLRDKPCITYRDSENPAYRIGFELVFLDTPDQWKVNFHEKFAQILKTFVYPPGAKDHKRMIDTYGCISGNVLPLRACSYWREDDGHVEGAPLCVNIWLSPYFDNQDKDFEKKVLVADVMKWAQGPVTQFFKEYFRRVELSNKIPFGLPQDTKDEKEYWEEEGLSQVEIHLAEKRIAEGKGSLSDLKKLEESEDGMSSLSLDMFGTSPEKAALRAQLLKKNKDKF